MTKMTNLLTALAIASISSVSLSCDVLECGPGTAEKNGECVPADGVLPENIFCDVGTHYDGALQSCVPDTAPTICDEATTTPIVDPITGIITCQGTGGGNACEAPCPQPTAGKNTVCGRLVDAETGDYITMPGDPQGTDCEDVPEAERSGPCAMKVEFYDALGFAQNPTGTAPLNAEEIVVNDCGWFKGTNIPTPALGFLAVSADDADGSGLDKWVLTGVAFPVAPGDRRPEQVTYVVSNDTDDTWTDSGGFPFGTSTSFADKGVFFPIFLLEGEPVAGVKITRDPAGVVANDDYYFSDTNPHTRATVDATQDATGANGAGLMVNSPLVDHGGTGGDLPTGCVWPPDLAKSIPGVVFANERYAVDEQGDDCVVP